MSLDWGDFYSSFEKRFRGPEETIKERLSIYKPYLALLNEVFSSERPLKALDIGCGRGEFLEILQSLGFDALGLEINEKFLTHTQKKGLKVLQEDALTFLKTQPTSTFHLISLIHVAEHLSPPTLVELLFHVHRVLKPCGLCILEFPNPENLSLGAFNFWLDPTHHRPLHPEFLKFVSEYLGFIRHKVIHTLGVPSANSYPTISHLFFGISQDIALILQKNGDPSLLEKFSPLFNPEPLPTLSTLTQRLDAFLSEISYHSSSLSTQVNNLSTQVNTLSTQLNNLFSEIRQLQNHVHHLTVQVSTLYHLRFSSRLLSFIKSLLRKYPPLYQLARRLYHRFLRRERLPHPTPPEEPQPPLTSQSFTTTAEKLLYQRLLTLLKE